MPSNTPVTPAVLTVAAAFPIPALSPMNCGAMPGYLYPTYSNWQTLLTTPGARLPSVIILDNDNGLAAWAAPFTTLCTQLHALGITVLGYIYTDYTAVALATAEASVGNYLGAGITPGANGVDGIFIDEFEPASGQLSYYTSLCSSIQTQFAAGHGSATPPIWGNCGSYVDSSYLALPVTTFITFENTIEEYVSITPYNVNTSGTLSSGSGTYARSRFAHLVFGASRLDVDGFVDRAWANFAGWAYASPGTGDNPYEFIPGNDYMNDLVSRAEAEPTGQSLGIPPWPNPVYQPIQARPALKNVRPRGHGGSSRGKYSGIGPSLAGDQTHPVHAPIVIRQRKPRRGHGAKAFGSTPLNATATPTVLAVSAAFPAPAASGGANASPAALAVAAAFPAVTVATGAGISPTTLAISTSLPAPTVSAGGGASASPAVLAVTTAFPAVTVATGAGISPATLAISTSLPAPTVSAGGGASASPAVLAVTTAFPAPAVTAVSTSSYFALSGPVRSKLPRQRNRLQGGHSGGITSISAAISATTLAVSTSFPAPTVSGNSALSASVTPARLVIGTTVVSGNTAAYASTYTGTYLPGVIVAAGAGIIIPVTALGSPPRSRCQRSPSRLRSLRGLRSPGSVPSPAPEQRLPA